MDYTIELKGAPTSVYFRRVKFGLLKLVVDRRLPTDDEIIEFDMIIDRLFGVKDWTWIHKNHLDLKIIQEIFKTIVQSETTEGMLTKVIKIIDDEKCRIKIGNSYFGQLTQNTPAVIIRRKHPRNQRKISNRRFMGVGYRDKGNKRNLAVDGSPKWEEVYKPEEEIVPMFYETEQRILEKLFGNFRNHFIHESVTIDFEEERRLYEKVIELSAQMDKSEAKK